MRCCAPGEAVAGCLKARLGVVSVSPGGFEVASGVFDCDAGLVQLVGSGVVGLDGGLPVFHMGVKVRLADPLHAPPLFSRACRFEACVEFLVQLDRWFERQLAIGHPRVGLLKGCKEEVEEFAVELVGAFLEIVGQSDDGAHGEVTLGGVERGARDQELP